jgi:hypothetical protein
MMMSMMMMINRPDVGILGRTMKEAYLIDVGIPNSQNICSIISKRLRNIQT